MYTLPYANVRPVTTYSQMTYSTLMMYKTYKMKIYTQPLYTLSRTSHCGAQSHATVLFTPDNVCPNDLHPDAWCTPHHYSPHPMIYATVMM